MKSSFTRNAVVLGLLSAAGPFAIDMYLPALPAIAADLHASTAATQGSLMAFFLAVAVFAAASLLCAAAPNIATLVALRIAQGAAGAAGIVISRAVVRDLHTGHEAARLMSLLMLVFSVSPILAPLFGSFVIQVGSWREIFWAIALIGILGLALTFFALRETRPPAQRIPFNLRTITQSYLELFRDRHYLGLVFIGGFGLASFFAFLAGSSFVYIGHFGLTPTQYSFAFSVNAIAFIGMAQLTGYFGKRFGLHRTVSAALTFYLVSTSAILVVTLAGVDNVFVLIAMLFAGFAAMGLVIPSTAALSLENYGRTAGTAAALMGTLQLVCGAVVVGIVGVFSNGTVLPMVTAIVVCAVIAFLLGRVTFRRAEAVAQPAE